MKKHLFLLMFMFLLFWTAGDMKSVHASSFSTNVGITLDKNTYVCAKGQKFVVKATYTTEELYDVTTLKYTGYLACLVDGQWDQIKSWNIYGGIVEYTFTLSADDYIKFGNSPMLFTFSAFPIDNFATGGSLVDKYFTVSFLPESYTLTYDANQGSCSLTTGTITYNCPYGTLPVPQRTGYSFDGWYTSKTDGAKVTADTTVTVMSNQTLYAHWTANSYTAILDAGAGICTPLSIPVVFDAPYEKLSTVSFTKIPADYRFDGWYTSATGGTNVTASSLVSIPTNHTLYAHWTRITPPETETPATETPTTETPATETPATEKPATETPATEKPVPKPTPPTVTPVSTAVTKFQNSKPALRLKIGGANKILVNWSKLANASFYEIYYSTSATSGYKKLKTLSSKYFAYSATGMKANTTYYFKLRGIASLSGKKYYSKLSSPVSIKAVGQPKTPAMKKTTIKGSSLYLNWKKQSGITKIEIYRSVGKENYKKLKTISGSKTSYKISLKSYDKMKKYRFCIKTYLLRDGVKLYSNASKPVVLAWNS